MRIIVIAYFVFRLVAAVAVSLLQVERDDDVGIQEPNATISGAHWVKPKDPRGFDVYIQLATSSRPYIPEHVYLLAIAVVHDWASEGWEHVIPSSAVTASKRVGDLLISWRSLAGATQQEQLQTKYLILGLLHLIDQMTRSNRFIHGVAVMSMTHGPIGIMEMRAINENGQSDISINDTTIEVNPVYDTQRRDLTTTKRIVDPEDSNFVIEYEVNGQRMTCVDVFSTIFYAMATAAQGSEEEFCRDLGGFNEKGTAVYRVHGLRPTASMHLLGYGLVRSGLNLLAPRLYAERACGRELTWSFLYRGDNLGFGSISVSDFAASTAK